MSFASWKPHDREWLKAEPVTSAETPAARRRLHGHRLTGRLLGGKAALLENYRAELEAARGRHKTVARRVLDGVILGIVAVPVLFGSLAEVLRTRARDRHSGKGKKAK